MSEKSKSDLSALTPEDTIYLDAFDVDLIFPEVDNGPDYAFSVAYMFKERPINERYLDILVQKYKLDIVIAKSLLNFIAWRIENDGIKDIEIFTHDEVAKFVKQAERYLAVKDFREENRDDTVPLLRGYANQNPRTSLYKSLIPRAYLRSCIIPSMILAVLIVFVAFQAKHHVLWVVFELLLAWIALSGGKAALKGYKERKRFQAYLRENGLTISEQPITFHEQTAFGPSEITVQDVHTCLECDNGNSADRVPLKNDHEYQISQHLISAVTALGFKKSVAIDILRHYAGYYGTDEKLSFSEDEVRDVADELYRHVKLHHVYGPDHPADMTYRSEGKKLPLQRPWWWLMVSTSIGIILIGGGIVSYFWGVDNHHNTSDRVLGVVFVSFGLLYFVDYGSQLYAQHKERKERHEPQTTAT